MDCGVNIRSALLVATLITNSGAFVPTQRYRAEFAFTPSSPSFLTRQSRVSSLNLFWFGKDGDRGDQGGEDLGGVSRVMDSMEGFKKSQQVGKLTSNLVKELGSTIVEGTAAEGKVKIFMDGQQRPKRVKIDEQYVEAVDIDDLSTALVAAMQDAYAKSREKQEEKMKDLYAELGLPQSSS